MAPRRWARAALTIAGVAVIWLGLFRLNAFIFPALEHSSRAHWIFLPAAWRVIAVLLFAETGVVGLVVGAFLTLPSTRAIELPFDLVLAVSSGLAPLVGVQVCRRIFPIAADLAGLLGWHILALSLATALANSVILNASMAMIGRFHGDFVQLATIAVGDMLGSAIVLSVISALLALVMARLVRKD